MMAKEQKKISGVEEWAKYWEDTEIIHPRSKWETAVDVDYFKVNMRRPHEEGSDLPEEYIVMLPILANCVHFYGHPDIGPTQRQECNIYDVKRCPIAKKAIDLYLEESKKYEEISTPIKFRRIRSFLSDLKNGSSKLE